MVRIRLDPAQRRDQLIELGAKMLSIRGFDDISIEEIAKKAGISRGLLFHYFPSKRDFHLAIAARGSDELLAILKPNTDLPPVDMVRDLLNRYVDYVLENRDGYTAILRGPSSGDPDMRSVADKSRKRIVDQTLSFVPLPPEQITPRIRLATRGWIAFVEETTLNWLEDQEQISREDLIDMNIRALPAVALSPEVAAVLLAAAGMDSQVPEKHLG